MARIELIGGAEDGRIIQVHDGCFQSGRFSLESPPTRRQTGRRTWYRVFGQNDEGDLKAYAFRTNCT